MPATSGNFSARIDENTIAITRSGTDKGALTRADILVVDLDAPDPRASAEAPLHYALYRDLPCGERRSSTSTARGDRAVARARPKARSGSGLGAAEGIRRRALARDGGRCPGLPQRPGYVRLAALASQQFAGSAGAQLSPGYVIAGHGLYAWGTSPEEAWRHTEALETLLAYQLT